MATTTLQKQLPVLPQQLLILHQQLPVLNQRPPSRTSRYQSWTSDCFPAPADTSSYLSWTSDHLLAPADTSPELVTIFLHQQKTVLHQWQLIQRLPVLHQLSRPTPVTRSCFNDHHPAAATVRRTLFRFTIRHNKVWPFEATSLFCHSCLVRCQSLIFQKFGGDRYIYLASIRKWMQLSD